MPLHEFPIRTLQILLPSLIVLGLLVLPGCARRGATDGHAQVVREPGSPELVVLGPILTLDGTQPRAGGLIVLGGRVLSVTDRATAAAAAGPGTEVVVVPEGGVAMPGIIESHAHLRSVGRRERLVDLVGTIGPDDVVARLQAAEATLPEGAWLMGRGWNQEHWPDRALPDRTALDAAFPARPVVLTRVDGHAAWVNGAALAASGITDETPSPQGGEIIRSEDGTASGVLVDNAMELIRAPGGTDPAEIREDLLRAQQAALALGITTFVDAGAADLELAVLFQVYEQHEMKLRVYAMRSVDSPERLTAVMAAPPVLSLFEDRLAGRAIKLYADGALGSRGALLIEPYADRPGHTGLPVSSPALIRQAIELGREHGWQVCVHAIGDAANRLVLDAVESVYQTPEASRAADDRHRIEHAQILDAEDIPRFRSLGVIPSMQTVHAVSDAPMYHYRLGPERAEEGAYAWRSLVERGNQLANGTDAPVEPLSPWLSLHAAVRRRTPGPEAFPAFEPRQRLNRAEALRSLTAWGAHAIFAEDRRGRLRPGYEADIIVLDRDPLTVPVADLPGVKVLRTIIAGKTVWEPE